VSSVLAVGTKRSGKQFARGQSHADAPTVSSRWDAPPASRRANALRRAWRRPRRGAARPPTSCSADVRGAVYEVLLTSAGNLISYRRIRRYTRGQVDRPGR